MTFATPTLDSYLYRWMFEFESEPVAVELRHSCAALNDSVDFAPAAAADTESVHLIKTRLSKDPWFEILGKPEQQVCYNSEKRKRSFQTFAEVDVSKNGPFQD